MKVQQVLVNVGVVIPWEEFGFDDSDNSCEVVVLASELEGNIVEGGNVTIKDLNNVYPDSSGCSPRADIYTGVRSGCEIALETWLSGKSGYVVSMWEEEFPD